LHALWWTYLATGLRRGAGLVPRRADLDLGTGTITVVRSLVAVGYEVRISAPKNGKRAL
jgi:hypothetical protein